MPLDIIPKALYPVVPFAPGVPALIRGGAQILDTLTLGKLGIADALSERPQWGIFNEAGKEIALADSVLSIKYSNSTRLSDYPQEQGAFSSYNKVENPWDVRITMTKGGSVNDRADFIDAIEAASKTTDLFTVMTPEVTYINANIEGWGYDRDARAGANMIVADIFIREVRQALTAAFTDTKNPASMDSVSQGQVQGVEDSTVSLASVTA